MQTSHNWTDSLPYAASIEVLRDLARMHAREGGTHGQKLESLLDKRDYHALCVYDLDYASPEWDILHLYHCRQAQAFFKKLECLDLGIDKEAVAFSKFKSAEESCKQSNTLFRHYARGTANCRPRDVRLLEAVRRKIASVLGRCPSISELKLSFGPGATTATKKPQACPAMKMAGGLQCSMDLLASGLLPDLLRELPHLTSAHESEWSLERDPEDELYEYVVEHVGVELHNARLEFVPKTAMTFRTITVEPMLNTLLQAGLRKWMKRRLSRAGIDLSDQSKNQRLALEGSITGELATLDLASASDTISTSLVRLLLPDDWYKMLSAARSSTVEYRGSAFALEKFSAMGNATTFPLESLIFWAITHTACEGTASVIGIYGDDIVCPVNRVHDVIRALNFCGFEVSASKSFWFGPFRESCGADYYRGFSVRPFYQKQLVSARTLFVLHNFYVRNSLNEYAAKVLEYIPFPLRIFGPDGYGDGHLLGDWSPRRPAKLLAKGFAGGTFETFSLVGKRFRPPFAGDYVSPLYAIYISEGAAVLPDVTWEDDAGRRRTVRTGLRETTETLKDAGGYPEWAVPGDNGYKRQRIYTFCT